MSTAIAALPFYGASLASFDPSDNSVIESTAAGTYDTTMSTCALFLPANGASSATTPTWTAAATFWAHAVIYENYVGLQSHAEFDSLYLLNSSTVVAKLTVTVPNNVLAIATYKLYTLQSAVLTLVGSITIPISVRQTFDINVVGNSASGSAALYVAGALAFSVGSLNHAGFTGVTQLKPLSNAAAGGSYYSQVKGDTVSTVGSFLRTDRLNHNSAVNTGWTGGVNNINEIPTNDSQFIYATVSNAISTFYQSSESLSGFVVNGRGVGARMRIQGTNPPKIKLVIRSGSTNFASTAIAAGAGFQAAFNSWTTDPHTSANWTTTNAALAESGVESSS